MQSISEIGDLFKSLIMEAVLKKNRNNIEMSINFESLTIEDIFIVNKISLKFSYLLVVYSPELSWE